MDQKVMTYIRHHHLIEQNRKVMIAVSGGPDSLALLHWLWRYQHTLAISLCVVTIDHQLRGDLSAADAQYVKDICKAWDIPCIVQAIDVDQYQKTHKVSTQVAARRCRYEALQHLMVSESADYLAFGHHADDQVETVLMALTRTAHVHNLAGMPIKRAFATGDIIRPLLAVTKAEIYTYIEAHGLLPRIDASNFEKNYTRNRIRADVVPLLQQENPNLAMTIRRLTQTLQEDETFLSEKANKALMQCVTLKDETATIYIDSFQTYPKSLQRKVFRLILDYLYETLPEQLSYKHEEMFFALVCEDRNRKMDFPGNLIAEKAYDRVYFYFWMPDDHTYKRYQLETVPGMIHLWDGTVLTSSTISTDELESKQNDPDTYIFSKETVCFPLTIRTREEGDRMTYDGLHGTKKLKKIFIDEKVPRYIRSTWPIVTDATGEILWLIGMRKNTKLLPNEPTYTCIEIQEP